jgi:hypothetical protein
MAGVTPIKSTTQQFTEIEDVQNDIVLFSDGSCALVIGVSAVNFSLLSEKEQDAMIYSYAQLLNSLSFPVQLIVRSQHKDVTAYLNSLADKERQQTNPKLAKSIHDYRVFVESTVKEKEVLDKKFYVVIPFSRIELGLSTSLLLAPKKRSLPYSKSYIFDRAATALLPKRDHLLRLLARLGINATQMTGEQIVRLFFSVYNPNVPIPATIDIPSGKSAARDGAGTKPAAPEPVPDQKPPDTTAV